MHKSMILHANNELLYASRADISKAGNFLITCKPPAAVTQPSICDKSLSIAHHHLPTQKLVIDLFMGILV